MVSTSPTSAVTRAALAAGLRNVSYEVLPFRGTEDAVLAHVPREVPLTVTTTEARGLEVTVELAIRLCKNGYAAAPHLAARLVRDRAELTDLVDRLHDGGVRRLFVIGGDAAEPAGAFPDALRLLEAIAEIGKPFAGIGIAGYPEGHGHIPDPVIDEALRRKSGHADEVVTQLCFSSESTIRWARRMRDSGVPTPIRVGLPGSINRQKLVRVSAGLGLGQSARFLAKQSAMFWRFFLPRGYRPDQLLSGLGPELARPESNLAGFHLFTFNDLANTERWRQRVLTRLT